MQRKAGVVALWIKLLLAWNFKSQLLPIQLPASTLSKAAKHGPNACTPTSTRETQKKAPGS